MEASEELKEVIRKWTADTEQQDNIIKHVCGKFLLPINKYRLGLPYKYVRR